jgi:hypothetical protein
VIYVGQPERTTGWYEAQLALPSEPSSVVRAFKTLCFPLNKKGEVTDEDFQLLELHGHIGEGRLQVAEDFPSHEADLDQTVHQEDEEKAGWKAVQQLKT